MKNNQNAKLFAVAREDQDFDIYLDLSGDAFYVMTHRKNAYVFRLLKNGVYLSDLERLIGKTKTELSYMGRKYHHGCLNHRYKTCRNYARKTENTLRHIQKNAQLCFFESGKAAA